MVPSLTVLFATLPIDIMQQHKLGGLEGLSAQDQIPYQSERLMIDHGYNPVAQLVSPHYNQCRELTRN